MTSAGLATALLLLTAVASSAGQDVSRQITPVGSEPRETSATLVVNDDRGECPRAGYTAIQRAVDAAAPGDVVHVCPGTSDEQVIIGKPLTPKWAGRPRH